MLDDENVKELEDGFNISYECSWNDLSFEENKDLLEHFEIEKIFSLDGDLYFMLRKVNISVAHCRMLKICNDLEGNQILKTMGVSENTYLMIYSALSSKTNS